jgi:hypothetical protein
MNSRLYPCKQRWFSAAEREMHHPQFPSFSAEIARTTLSALKTGAIGRDF